MENNNPNNALPHNEGSFQARVLRTILLVLGTCVLLHIIQDVLHMFQYVDVIWGSFTLYLMVRLVRGHRDLDLGGHISFLKAFFIAWLPGLIGSIFTATAIYFSSKYIIKDELLKYIKDEKYIIKMANAGMEGGTNFWIEWAEKVMTWNGYMTLLQYFGGFFLLAAFVIALSVRRS